MPKKSRLTKAQIVKLLEEQGIEASSSQKKDELLRILELAKRANKPTGQSVGAKKTKNGKAKIWLAVSLILIFILVTLFRFNPVFNQNIKFLAFKLFGLGNDPIASDDSSPQIYEKNGKTYVVYNFPLVRVSVLTDKSCKRPECDLGQYYSQIRENITNLVKFNELDFKDGSAKNLIEKFNINLLPVFIFDKHVEKTEKFKLATRFLTPVKDKYILQVTPFRVLESPNLANGQILGVPLDQAAPLTVVQYTSFSSPHAADVIPATHELLKRFEGNITMVIKYFHRGGNDLQAAVAAECAALQGSFLPMYEKLFSEQVDWIAAEERFLTAKFTKYAAQIGIHSGDFRNCYTNSDDLRETIKSHNTEASAFAITGTPTFFVNNRILTGAYETENLISIVNQILAQDDIKLDNDVDE